MSEAITIAVDDGVVLEGEIDGPAIVTGASHFFVGRADAVVAAADGLIGRVGR
jgi:hypothetical protein